MNTTELISILRGCHLTNSHATDVFAADELPLSLDHYPTAIISNTDGSDKSGTHWTAFYFPNKNAPAEFFDSFGRPPEFYNPHFKNFLENNATKWLTTPKWFNLH